MLIRPETPADYAAINHLHLRAFGGMDAPMIAHNHRQMPHYDPALALVAEEDQKILGHVLFTPHTISLLEADVPVVVLSPIGIEPGIQKQGIGSALIHAGHRIAKEKGFVLSFLIGHDSYYPRFGYRTNAFGSSSLTLPTPSLPTIDPAVLTIAPPTDAHVEALLRLWRYEENRVDFALVPDAGLLDWVSPNQAVKARVYLREGNVVGYTLIHAERPNEPVVFLAADAHAAQAMAVRIGQGHNTITLPLHPYSASSAALGKATVQVWGAAMACPLQGDVLDRYFDQVQRGMRVVGRPQWGRPYDLSFPTEMRRNQED